MTDIINIKETDIIMNSRDAFNNNFDLLKSNFAGSEYPDSPVEGMLIFKNGAWETFKSGSWVPEEQLHNHDGKYYTETEINQLLSGKSDSAHNHDDRYYTESEIDQLFQNITNSSHTHDSRYYTETETDDLLQGKSKSDHTHAQYALQTQVGSNASRDVNISTASPSGGSNGDVWYKY